MPLSVATTEDFPLRRSDMEPLYRQVRDACAMPDDIVSIADISREQMQELNRTYRGQDKPTNVLTFSYPAEKMNVASIEPEHDIVVCMEVARAEAEAVQLPVRDYVAWLIVHGLLHAAGLDHEASAYKAQHTEQLEQRILEASGFTYQPRHT